MKKTFWAFMGLCLLLLVICCVAMYFLWPTDSAAIPGGFLAYLSVMLVL